MAMALILSGSGVFYDIFYKYINILICQLYWSYFEWNYPFELLQDVCICIAFWTCWDILGIWRLCIIMARFIFDIAKISDNIIFDANKNGQIHLNKQRYEFTFPKPTIKETWWFKSIGKFCQKGFCFEIEFKS